MMREQRDLVMRRGPEHSGRVVQIAVALDVDGQAAMFAIGERRAHGGRCSVADARAALRADELIMFREIPQPAGQELTNAGQAKPATSLRS